MVAAGAKHLFFHDFVQTLFGFLVAGSNDDPFAQCKTVRLDDHRVLILFFDVAQRFCRVIKHLISSGWNVKLLHQVFGEHLAGFNLCCILGWTKGHDAFLIERIHHTCCQRVIGSYNDQVNAVLLGKPNDTVDIHRLDVHTLRIHADAAVAGTAVDCFGFWTLF